MFYLHPYIEFDFSIRFRLTVRDPSNQEYFSLRSLHSFCVPGEYAESILVPTENARKVFKRLRRMRGKYLSGYLRYKNRLRMRGKYLNVFGECAERIYASMEKTQKGSLRILQIRQEM
jgi:hypothetical protein